MNKLFIALFSMLISFSAFSQNNHIDEAIIIKNQAKMDHVMLMNLANIFSISDNIATSMLNSNSAATSLHYSANNTWPATRADFKGNIYRAVNNIYAANDKCPSFNSTCYKNNTVKAKNDVDKNISNMYSYLSNLKLN